MFNQESIWHTTEEKFFRVMAPKMRKEYEDKLQNQGRALTLHDLPPTVSKRLFKRNDTIRIVGCGKDPRCIEVDTLDPWPEWCEHCIYKKTFLVYLALYFEQGGVCKICGSPPEDGKMLVLDHDHDTLLVRGLLCDNCNLALGLLKDNVDSINAAADYLKLHRSENRPKLIDLIQQIGRLDGSDVKPLTYRIPKHLQTLC